MLAGEGEEVMEKANKDLTVHRSRYVEIVPAILRDMAARMELEAERGERGKDKIFVQLTDGIILFYDPDQLNVAWDKKGEK